MVGIYTIFQTHLSTLKMKIKERYSLLKIYIRVWLMQSVNSYLLIKIVYLWASLAPSSLLFCLMWEVRILGCRPRVQDLASQCIKYPQREYLDSSQGTIKELAQVPLAYMTPAHFSHFQKCLASEAPALLHLHSSKWFWILESKDSTIIKLS